MTKRSHITGNVFPRCVTHDALHTPERVGQTLPRRMGPNAPVHILFGRFAEHGEVIEAVPATQVRLVAKVTPRVIDGFDFLACAEHVFGIDTITARHTLQKLWKRLVVLDKVGVRDV